MLNLPQTAVKGTTSLAYIYDATGRKLRKLSTTGSTTTITEYINGIEYDYTGSTPVLSYIQTEEGRARKSGTVYKYEYDLKDHLGNTRITTTWDGTNTNQQVPLNSQRSDYYAFGYTIQSLIGSTPSPKNEYLYNHKELQEETGLYDYGARFYDPVIGRWNGVDPLAEKGRRETPYGYAFDDPMRFTDPDGMWPDDDSFKPNKNSRTDIGPNVYFTNMPKPQLEHHFDLTMEDAGTALSVSGTALTTVGYVTSPIGGAALIPAGEGIGAVGTYLSITNDVKKGDYGSAATTFVLDKGFGALGKVVEDAKGINATGKLILGATISAYGKVTDMVVDKIKSDNLEKKEVKPAPKLANTKHNRETQNYAQAFFKKANKKDKQ